MGKWIRCSKCGHRYDQIIGRCPVCYTKAPVSGKKIIAVVAVVVTVGFCAVGAVLGIAGVTLGGSSSLSSDVTTSSAASAPAFSDGDSSSHNSSQVSPAASSSSLPDSSVPSSSSKPKTSSVENTSSAKTYRQPSDSDGSVKVADSGEVTVTFPKWLVGIADEEIDEFMTDTSYPAYFRAGKNNNNGTVSYTIDVNNDYHKFLLTHRTTINGNISGIKNEFDSVSDVEFTYGEYTKIKIYTTANSVQELDTLLSIYVLGLGAQITMYQYADMDQDASCVFEYYSPDKQLIGTSTFPDLIKANG